MEVYCIVDEKIRISSTTRKIQLNEPLAVNNALAHAMQITVFEEDGSVSLETDAYEEDILYDEISSGLLVREIKMKRQELMESLSLYYRIFVLKESADEVLEG